MTPATSHFLQTLSPQIVLAVVALFMLVYVLIAKSKTGYRLVKGDELSHRSDKLARFLSMVYIGVFLVWGMFVVPINAVTGSLPTMRSLIYMLAAITLSYVISRIIFRHRYIIYAFAIGGTIGVIFYILQHQGVLKEFFVALPS